MQHSCARVRLGLSVVATPAYQVPKFSPPLASFHHLDFNNLTLTCTYSKSGQGDVQQSFLPNTYFPFLELDAARYLAPQLKAYGLHAIHVSNKP